MSIKSRFMSTVMAIALFLNMCPITLAYASTTPSVTIAVDHNTVLAGTYVDVTFTLDNNPGMNGFGLSIGYESSVLALESTADIRRPTTDIGLASSIFTAGNIANNPYRVSWISTGKDSSDGILVIATFKVLDEAGIGDSPITATIFQAFTD